jgi:hypothetical protein
MREFYKAKGYSDEWIGKRVRGIAIRDGSWLLPLQRLYNHGLPLEGELTNDMHMLALIHFVQPPTFRIIHCTCSL